MSYTRGPGVQHWHSIDTITDGPLTPTQSSGTSQTFPAANTALYFPVVVRQRVVVKQLWFACGSTTTGNYDLGLYDASGVALLRRGSTSKPGTLAEAVWDCTDTTIGPGVYYLALASSNNTDTFVGASVGAPFPAALGVYSEASALPLPATATFAVPQTLAIYLVVGMYLDTRVT